MTFTIEFGWWIIPALLSIAALWWCSRQDYSGDYNFNAVFTVPVTGMAICFFWMVYFGIGWALS